jgi:hypothetical protein
MQRQGIDSSRTQNAPISKILPGLREKRNNDYPLMFPDNHMHYNYSISIPLTAGKRKGGVVIGYQLLVISYRLSVIGYWLSVLVNIRTEEQGSWGLDKL